MPVPLHLAEQTRERLQTRRAELMARQRRTSVDLAHRTEPLAADSGEQAVQLQNDEALEVIGAAALDEVLAIDEALERLARGLFGICKQCGAEIAVARLHAVPQATRCAVCAQKAAPGLPAGGL